MAEKRRRLKQYRVSNKHQRRIKAYRASRFPKCSLEAIVEAALEIGLASLEAAQNQKHQSRD